MKYHLKHSSAGRLPLVILSLFGTLVAADDMNATEVPAMADVNVTASPDIEANATEAPGVEANATETPDVETNTTKAPGVETNATETPDISVNETDAPVTAPTDPPTFAPIVNTTNETMVPTPETPTFEKLPCYDNLTVLAEHMLLKDAFEPMLFNLCPDTVFDIGYDYGDTETCCIDGQSPLVPRSNSRIYCGEDGDPKNNCTLINGANQLVSSLFTFFPEETDNVEVRGVTFSRSTSTGIVLSNGGSITLKDCIMMNQRGVAPITSLLLPFEEDFRRRRLLESDMKEMNLWERIGFSMREYQKHVEGIDSIFSVPQRDEIKIGGEDRRLDDLPLSRQMVTLDGCEFYNNEQGESGEDLEYGIITIAGPLDDWTLMNNYFHDNEFGDPLDQRGYAISVAEGSTLRLTDNCFIDNNFIGSGVVVMASRDNLIAEERNFATEDEGLQCQLAVEQKDGDTIECIAEPADECSIEGVEAPSSPPSSSLLSFASMSPLAAVLIPLLFCAV